MTDHFKPLWARNVPKFGIGHAMALGVSNHNTSSTHTLFQERVEAKFIKGMFLG